MQSNGSPRRTRAKAGIYYREDAGGRRRYEFSYTDSDGRRRWKTVDGNLREAEAQREELRSRVRRGERVAPTRQTLAEVAQEWLDSRAQLRPRTLETYSTHLRVHVLPRLGRKRIAAIDESDILRLIADLQGDGRAAWTIHGVLTPLSGVFNYAVRRGLVAANPIRRLEPGERPSVAAQSDKRILSGEEIAALLAVASPTYRPLLATAIYTGLRLGELLGLTWADIDLDAGLLRVRKQLDRHGRRVEPKTRQALRDVVLLPALGRLLREHRLRSPHSGARDFVFASAAGTPLAWRNVARRGLDLAARQAGLEDEGKPKLTMHALRNTFASHLIVDLRLDVVQVSRMLGHAKPSITSDTYARLFDQARHSEDIRRRMEESAFGTVLERAGGHRWRNPPSSSSGEVVALQEVRN